MLIMTILSLEHRIVKLVSDYKKKIIVINITAEIFWKCTICNALLIVGPEQKEDLYKFYMQCVTRKREVPWPSGLVASDLCSDG